MTILVVFYQVMSMNGLVLGNDPAVHLEKALIFLDTGQISLSNLGWTPPLYSILVAVFIAFTNAGSLEQLIIVVKVAAVLIDWLLFFSVYLLGAKFFGRRVGATAAVLLLLSFPIFELNLWGGYTTVLALAFMFLVLLYTPLATERFGYLLVTFFVAFALVLSHQLATFLAAFIMPPIMLFMLIKSKGAHFRVVIALVLGGGVAFFLYYFQAIIGYLDVVIEYVFFAIKEYAYQIPGTSFDAFVINFGFVFFLALSGIVIAYHYLLKAQRKPIFYLILMLSFFVPFFFAESYLVGLYLPFQWFIYYMTPPMVILAAVTSVFAFDKVQSFYLKNKNRVKKVWMKAVIITVVVLVASMVLFRFGTVYGKIMEGSVHYSTSDLKALEAGLWLKNNYPENTTVVVTYVPGFWFRLFSGKTVIASTDPIIHRNEITESVLDLSYEVEKSYEAEKPLALFRAYEAKGAISHESFVSLNRVWNRVAFSSGDGDSVLYSEGGVEKEVKLSIFSREIIFEDETSSSKRLSIRYGNQDLVLTQNITIRDESYPMNVSWTVTPLRSEISDIALYVSIFFDLQFHFEKAYVPGVLDWENPWSRPSDWQGTDWAVIDFSNSTLTDRYLGFYAEKEDVAFALKLEELPDWGNIGALTSMQIDAIRLRYNFSDLNVNQNESFTYQVLTFSKSSYPEMPTLPIDVKSLFALEPAGPFDLASREYRDYIKENDIGFIVYDKNQLDTKIIRSKLLELVYSNDRYVIFKIKNIT
ncbi:MAG TPA: hypothetical protein VJL33_08300 [Candidatus Bathyarchaeia archaeon]|nr:hypothetical protein [Candidatus Bathyarchaeia archaeon]